MNTESLKQYLQARDALKEGKEAEALNLLAASLGTDKPTEMMKSSYGKLLELNDAALQIIIDRSTKG